MSDFLKCYEMFTVEDIQRLNDIARATCEFEATCLTPAP
jgi:hypothetical protein